MSSAIYFIKCAYSTERYQTQVKMAQNQIESFKSFCLFEEDCFERIGKQFISILVSISMIKSRTQSTNRDISLALKKFEEDLVIKMKANSKKELYGIFGRYTFKQLQNLEDNSILQIELAQMFFRRLKFFSDQNQSLAKFRPLPYERFSTLTSAETSYSNSDSTTDTQRINRRGPVYNFTVENHLQKLNTIFEEQPRRSNLTDFANKKFPTSDEGLTDEERSLIEDKNGENDEDSFSFNFTQKDTEVVNRDPSEQYFINLVAYLKNLSSPQGQLTYIWQHLKWQGFETSYEQFLNQKHEWVCSAKITFSVTMAAQGQSYLQRTQTSRNKKKARQLACMELLKSLYLEYPQVWLMYKHLKQEKKLTIAPLEEPKDDDELAIITKRSGYKMNRQKIKKLFSHDNTDIRRMMEKISAKAELNTLLQQLPGRVTSPKIQKKIVQGFWSVPVRIQYRTDDHIEHRIPPKVYEKTVICQNARFAQEQAYMQAIIDLYQDNPLLFEKIQSIKIAKNIKDAEKKLPLMKNFIKDSFSPQDKTIGLI